MVPSAVELIIVVLMFVMSAAKLSVVLCCRKKTQPKAVQIALPPLPLLPPPSSSADSKAQAEVKTVINEKATQDYFDDDPDLRSQAHSYRESSGAPSAEGGANVSSKAPVSKDNQDERSTKSTIFLSISKMPILQFDEQESSQELVDCATQGTADAKDSSKPKASTNMHSTAKRQHERIPNQDQTQKTNSDCADIPEKLRASSKTAHQVPLTVRTRCGSEEPPAVEANHPECTAKDASLVVRRCGAAGSHERTPNESPSSGLHDNDHPISTPLTDGSQNERKQVLDLKEKVYRGKDGDIEDEDGMLRLDMTTSMNGETSSKECNAAENHKRRGKALQLDRTMSDEVNLRKDDEDQECRRGTRPTGVGGSEGGSKDTLCDARGDQTSSPVKARENNAEKEYSSDNSEKPTQRTEPQKSADESKCRTLTYERDMNDEMDKANTAVTQKAEGNSAKQSLSNSKVSKTEQRKRSVERISQREASTVNSLTSESAIQRV